MTVLVTGAAGFIGYHVAERLLSMGEEVVGVDNLNTYYDVTLKQGRLDQLARHPGFRFHKLDVSDREAVGAVVAANPGLDRIVHLAAQAGVRHSLIDPWSYIQSNVMGHLGVLEVARHLPKLRHLVYASTSSVYGANRELPFRETDRVDTPISLYAATKRADELMSHSYAHLFSLPQTALRFFTVYGPWGRPDMACYSFARAIVAGEPITLYEGGELRRDFTYVDDIVAGVVGALAVPPDGRVLAENVGEGASPWARIMNIGNHRSEKVIDLVRLLEESLGRKAIIRTAPRPDVDVPETFAAVDKIGGLTGFSPSVRLSEGVPRFVAWFRKWHAV